MRMGTFVKYLHICSLNLILLVRWFFNLIYLFVIMVSFLRRRKSNTIVLAGLSGSGKTTLFYQALLRKWKRMTIALFCILMLIRYLYNTLTKASVVEKKIPILIVCNKSDKVTAHSKEFIRKHDKLRTSRTAISTVDITNEHNLGVPAEAFTFSQCVNKITVAESSAEIDESSPRRETTALAVEEDVVSPNTIPEASCHPGKEPIRVDDGVKGRAKTPSNQMENGADGRILEDMPSVGIHQAQPDGEWC
ncbi:uncharacterized protein A4U43_C01F14910 [Asparagus officinalis]|uniref:Uncharacterized protein n=1 Tax=Asparagus officinalis TaxID=4686 RepID=A0A5P1FU00_ASPOF|nr:uncharacterized protein A4U43_C01F14910 [Asparagus officinalis]